MHVEAVAVQKVLHVIEVELDVAPSVVVPKGLGGILLGIGEDGPETAVAVDVCINGLLVQGDFPSSFGSLPHGEIGVIEAPVPFHGIPAGKLLLACAQPEHQRCDVLLPLVRIEVDMTPGPAVRLGSVIGDPVDVGPVILRVADDVGVGRKQELYNIFLM